MLKERNQSIDILKFLAVLLIVNSHMDPLYGKFSPLATGGTIGDVLFVFNSGFTLFLGTRRGFDNFYKRRINRIYPTVFGWAVIGCLFFDSKSNLLNVILFGGGDFVAFIMISYVIIYFIAKYCLQWLKYLLAAYTLVCIGVYFTFDKSADFNMYGNIYKWFCFFAFMVQGAMVGYYSKNNNRKQQMMKDLIKLVGCIVGFFALYAFKKYPSYNFIQTLSMIPLFGVTYYAYCLFHSSIANVLQGKPKIWLAIRFVGGLCLEVYLVNLVIIHLPYPIGFPFSALAAVIIIIAIAYMLRCLSRIWSQTFKDTDYQWKEVFKLL